MRYSKGGVGYADALAMTWPELVDVVSAIERLIERENEANKAE
jgi:hypothetical protein